MDKKIKLRLAECLAKEADLYLLDEPTNHFRFGKLQKWVRKNILKEKHKKSLNCNLSR